MGPQRSTGATDSTDPSPVSLGLASCPPVHLACSPSSTALGLGLALRTQMLLIHLGAEAPDREAGPFRAELSGVRGRVQGDGDQEWGRRKISCSTACCSWSWKEAAGPRPSGPHPRGHRLIPGAEHCPPSGAQFSSRIAPAQPSTLAMPGSPGCLLVSCEGAPDAESGRCAAPPAEATSGPRGEREALPSKVSSVGRAN